jgi:hypothetical protein
VTFDRHPPADFFFFHPSRARNKNHPLALRCVYPGTRQERLVVDSWLVSCPAFQHQHAVCIHFIIIIALKKPSPSPGNRLRTTTTTTTSIRHPPSSVTAINSLWNISTSNPPPPWPAAAAAGGLAFLEELRCHGRDLLQPLYNCVGFIRWSGGVQLSCYISFTIYAQQLILHWLTD